MHIEPGYVVQAKIVVANVVASGVLLAYSKSFIKQPADIVRTLIAAFFFTVFMESFFMSVGPSELHFVGAMVMYLSLGFIPTLFGFAIGLLFQGLIFQPTDLIHLGVNSLTLILPLVAVHFTIGQKLRNQALTLRWQTIVKLDAMYYAGVTSMVGFWLLISNVVTPFTAWMSFAASYLAIVALEPVITYSLISLLKRYPNNVWLNTCFAVKTLNIAK